jgi:Zn-dependent protease/CBS domain-containing protein
MFGRGFVLMRLFGFAVRVDSSWAIIAALVTWSLSTGFFPARYPGLGTAVYWTMGIAGAVGLFGSIVFHELSHSLMARRFGLEIRGITLFIFGGVAEMSEEPPSPKSEFLTAVVGPLSSLVLAAGAYGLGILLGTRVPDSIHGVLVYLAGINLILALFNLIPAFPLDGGRLLRAILWARQKSIRRATGITARMGSGFGLLLILFGVWSFIRGNFVGGVWYVLIGLFLRGAAGQAYRQVVMRGVLEGQPVQRFMNPNPVTVSPETYVRDLIEDYLYRTHHKFYPVVDDGRLLGSVTLARVREVPREKWDWIRVQDITVPCSAENTISPSTDALSALTRMQRHGVSRLMVVEGERLVGMLSLRDLMAFLTVKMELETA